MQKLCIYIPFCLLILLLYGCTSVVYKEDPAKYRDEIMKLKNQLKNDPNDFKTLKELGIINFKIANYEKARFLLDKSFKLKYDDAQTILYYGLALEFLQQKDEAIRVYKNFDAVSVISPYRNKIEGRYHWLSRQKIQEQMRSLVLQETQLSEDRIMPGKIAVFPFQFISGNQDYDALGRGLAEMIITDLSQVDEIQLVERARIQLLLEEMALGQTGLIEENTAVRFGKLLAAGKIVTGNYTIAEQKQLILDAAMWDIIKKRFPQFSQKEDVLDNLFKLEKDIVFDVIEDMGIQLTMEEKKKIQLVPTRNIQAFMTYCMGLELQDAGKFEAAARQFKRANQLDPQFEKAKSEAQKAGSTGQAAGSKEKFAGAIVPAAISPLGTDRLVTDRLRSLNVNVGSNFNPGEDNREAGEEAANAGADIGLQDLPDPPRPPGAGR